MRFLPPLPLGGGREEAFFAHSHIHRFTHPCVLISSVISKHKPHYENVPFEIPENWEWVKLDDCCTKITDFVASGSFASLRQNVTYYKEENYAVLVRTLDFGNGFKKDLVYTDKHGYDFLRNSNLVGGELILSNIGASIGKVFIVPKLDKLMTLGPNSILVKTCSDSETQYLYCVFSSLWGWDLLHDISSATAQGKFNKTDLKNVLIPLPPLAEQQRIVAEVEKWFALIDDLEVNKDDLKEYIKQVKSKILSLAISGKLVSQDPNDEPAIELLKRINPNFKPCDTSHYENLPHGWEATSLANVIYLLDNKRKPIKAEERAKRIEGKDVLYPYYGATGFVGYIDEYLIEGKFLLLGEDGAPFLDKHADKAYSVEGKVWVNNHAHILLPRIDFDYLKIYLNAFNYHGIAKGTTRLKLTQGDMNSILVAVPPLAEQQRISNLVEQIFTIINSISAEL